jgi:hypothetical protein
LRVARAWSVSPSVFGGRPLSTVTEHVYDGDRLVRSTATQEAAWSDTDRALAEALDLFEAGLCQGCGQPKDRAWHPDQLGWMEVRDNLVCEGCRVTAEWQEGEHDKGTVPRLIDTRPASNPLPPWPADLLD